MRLSRRICGPTFVLAGALHFVMPTVYTPMVPPYLPAPEALVYASGAAQIAGGAGLMTNSTRGAAGWWLIATLIAMFPANVHMAMNPDEYPGFPGGATALWARLPLQGALIAWVRAAMRADDAPHR
jgi:uncharacterized membrane protein